MIWRCPRSVWARNAQPGPEGLYSRNNRAVSTDQNKTNYPERGNGAQAGGQAIEEQHLHEMESDSATSPARIHLSCVRDATLEELRGYRRVRVALSIFSQLSTSS